MPLAVAVTGAPAPAALSLSLEVGTFSGLSFPYLIDKFVLRFADRLIVLTDEYHFKNHNTGTIQPEAEGGGGGGGGRKVHHYYAPANLSCDGIGNSLLCWAIRNDRLQIAKFLLSRLAPPPTPVLPLPPLTAPPPAPTAVIPVPAPI